MLVKVIIFPHASEYGATVQLIYKDKDNHIHKPYLSRAKSHYILNKEQDIITFINSLIADLELAIEAEVPIALRRFPNIKDELSKPYELIIFYRRLSHDISHHSCR